MTVDDGTAECRLWCEGDTLIKGVMRMPSSTLADIQTAALRLGPQTYSAAAEDDLSSSTAGSLHSRRSQVFQKFVSGGGGAGTGRRLHLLVRPPPPQDPATEYEMRPVVVWTGDRFPMQKRPPTHLRAVAAEPVRTTDYTRKLLQLLAE